MGVGRPLRVVLPDRLLRLQVALLDRRLHETRLPRRRDDDVPTSPVLRGPWSVRQTGQVFRASSARTSGDPKVNLSVPGRVILVCVGNLSFNEKGNVVKDLCI